ncbi:MAG: GAF domain-containing protein [Chloroflexia bacterium]|nr:GAF domain-containing protein [Chloroflexia bacterium]
MSESPPNGPKKTLPQAALLRRLDVLQQADLILHHTEDLDLLLRRFLELLLETTQTESGTLYLVDEQEEQLVFAVVIGPTGVDEALQGHRMPIGRGIVGHAAQKGEPIWLSQIEHSRHWARDLAKRSGYRPRNVLCLPLKAQGQVIAVVQLFDRPAEQPLDENELEFLVGLVNDLALKVENARLLDETREMVARQRALLDVSLELGTTLDRDRLLQLILERIIELLRAEDASIFELDEQKKELVLLKATRIAPDLLGTIRVPVGTGIAGWVAEHGETVLVPDVTQDERFYAKVDQETSFVTRSILCTPLVVQEQVPGQEGLSRRRLVGVAQVLNKKGGGRLSRVDQEIFEGLAGQAAIAMERTRLYQQINELFTSAIAALAEAMEAKDPYTRGHTRRVTAMSVAIAKELGLSAEEVLRIRLAGLLHDIGKIGMPDAILKKAGRVNEEEMAIIRRHPLEGARILQPLHHLQDIVCGVAEHHERYDGSGYPSGLQGEEISLAGRIIAVADTFDAMTSTRPYRQALPAEVARKELCDQAGRQFDPQVVQAFCSAWDKGRISPEKQDSLSEPTAAE